MHNDMRSMFQLDNKVALVTGASKGIGEAMAYALAGFGASVVVSSRKQDAVDEVADSFKTDGLEATGIAANMGNIEDIQSLVDKTVKNLRRSGHYYQQRRRQPGVRPGARY